VDAVNVEEKIREVRRELEALQSADHPANVEQKRQDYVDGLKREKAMAAQQLATARGHDPGSRESLHSDRDNPNALAFARLTWGERAAELEQTVAAIDAELERVQSPLA
jgi:hypothetical protein